MIPLIDVIQGQRRSIYLHQRLSSDNDKCYMSKMQGMFEFSPSMPSAESLFELFHHIEVYVSAWDTVIIGDRLLS